MRLIPHRSVGTESGLRSTGMESDFSFYFKISFHCMARVISTPRVRSKTQNIYFENRPFLKVYDRECLEDQKAKEGLIPFPSNIQQLMVRTLIMVAL